MKGKVSTTGYKKDSPDKDNDYNIIPGNVITMAGVLHDVLGIDDAGMIKKMKPGGNYKFAGDNVLEIPMKSNKLKISDYPQEVQDRFLAFMQMGGGILLDQYQNGGTLPKAQQGSTGGIRTIGRTVQASAEEQKLGRQFNFQNVPELTERSAWNKFLENVQKEYPANSDKAKSLNYGKPEDAKKKFNELATGYNTQSIPTWKQDYARISAKDSKGNPVNKGFDAAKLTEEQYVKSRQVTEGMMQNAQKFYGQQTDKDSWFGSETAQSYYPQITPVKQQYTAVVPGQMDKVNAAAAGKFVPVEVTPYTIPGQPKPASYSQAVAPITGYDQTGHATIDFKAIRPYAQADSVNMYFDKAIAMPELVQKFAPYLTPNASVPAIPTRKFGGDTKFSKSLIRNIVGELLTKKTSGNSAPQGMDTNSYIKDQKETFTKHLKQNSVSHMISEELEGVWDPGNNILQYGGGPDVLPTNMATLPEFDFGNPDIMESPLDIEAQNMAAQQMEIFMQQNQALLKQKQGIVSNGVATAGLGAMDIFSSAVERGNTKQYAQNNLNTVQGASNIFGTTVGNKGNYDINNGTFKPNQTGTPVYKHGGSYELDEREIKDLIRKGYTVKYVD